MSEIKMTYAPLITAYGEFNIPPKVGEAFDAVQWRDGRPEYSHDRSER